MLLHTVLRCLRTRRGHRSGSAVSVKETKPMRRPVALHDPDPRRATAARRRSGVRAVVVLLAIFGGLAPAGFAGAETTTEVPVSGTFTATSPFQTDCGGRGPGISRFVFEGTADLAPFGPTTTASDI